MQEHYTLPMQTAQIEFDLDIIITAEIKDGQIAAGQQ